MAAVPYDMLPELNPFSPGAGQRPPNLVGRDPEIDAFDLLVARTRAGRTGRPLALHGLRGVGKTVLLRRLEEHAVRAGWWTVWIEAAPTPEGAAAVRRRVSRDFRTIGHRLERGGRITEPVRRALDAVQGFSVSVAGSGVSLALAPPDDELALDLEDVVSALGPVLQERGSALAVFVDEMQDLDRELLGALLAAQHRAIQLDLPFFVLGAGLSSLPGVLAGARSYSERMLDHRSLGVLAAHDAAAAITLPALERGVEFAPDAAATIVEAAQGYPFFLQLFAERAWDLAADRVVTQAEAVLAIELGWADLDEGFFPARWSRATPAERRYLSAIAECSPDAASTAWIAERLAVPAANLTTVRRSLIDKGMVYAPERGIVAFTVPGMAAYIERHWRDG